jgi:hypothetical protein
VLDPDVPAQQRVICVGDVTRGVDVRVRGLQRGAGPDAVADLQPGCLGKLGVGRDADADDDDVRGDVAAVREPQPVGAATASGDVVHPGAKPQVDVVIPVQFREHLGYLAAEHAQQRQFGHLDHGDFGTGGAGRGGALQPDPARADHGHALRGLKGGLDRVAVADPAQVVHAAELGTRDLQATR